MSKIKLKKYDPSKSFKDKKKVSQALSQAMLEGDLEAVQDILYGYLSHQNKQSLAKKTKLSRSSIYNAIKGNPSMETLLKILKEAS